MPDHDLQRTALSDLHEDVGARMADFAGWSMPIEFDGTLAEHHAVRDGVGIFDVSHLGTVWITGSGAQDTVAATFTNDPAGLDDGGSQYTLCCDPDGGIVDDLIVYRLAGNRFLAVPNAANTADVVARLDRAAGSHGADVDDASTGWAILAVQGPRALRTVRESLGIDAEAIPYLGLDVVERQGEELLVCRTGYTGEPGCELVLPNALARDTWESLVDGGAVPVGLGARDTLRLEMGYPLHGNDLGRDTNPYEARLGWAVKLDRGGFTGQEALRALEGRGVGRRLLGVRGTSRRPPRAGMAVTAGGEPVGRVTSGGFSPTLEVGIGLAYLDRSVEVGAEVAVDVRGTEVPFEVVRPPFVDRSPRG